MKRSEYMEAYKLANKNALHFEMLAVGETNKQEKIYFQTRAAAFRDEAKAWLEAHYKG